MNKLYIYSVLLGLLLSVFSSVSEGCKGCVNLDEYNFDKIVSRFEAVLVKFDVNYPYGDKHDVFNTLATEIVDSKNLILGQVAIKDYGEKENEEFAKKFGIQSKEDLPALRLFVQGEDEPFAFHKNMLWNNENLKKFIVDHTNIYLGLPGCLETFDKLANKFSKANDKDSVLKEAEKAVAKLDTDRERDIAKTYIKFMKKTIEAGDTFINQEQKRLNKIVSEGKVNEKKKRELSNRLNILKSFSQEVSKTEL
ncbi:protein windbeutel [Diabrotica virgifera virgifera]|uniref:Protein windbeutel n=1 Tax=Diabrotica virgifera virgifera TaxID=50390 RepID=A0ABM5JX22_DIAVI|nr:protein windbeutel [Diabrotica virgifera virgifera]